MKITLLTTGLALAAASPLNHFRHIESDQVDAWGQCGGKNYQGDKACTSGFYCKPINEWFSQCQPGGDNEVGVWGQCGGKNYTGSTKCTAGNTCKAWDEWNSQCVPSNDSPSTLPSSYVASDGVCFDKCQGDTDVETSGITSFEACVNEANARGKWNAVWDGKTCLVLSTVYTYKMDPACKSAAKFDSENFSCVGNANYNGFDIGNMQTRFSRCLDSCKYYTSGGKNCNAVTFVQNPGQNYGTCFLKSIDTSATPGKSDLGATACKMTK
ncbi:hypothetical protein SPRG_22299 [Saprolegnia parasitica CBS 223.65]|uniref:CBM1 domain-containing protein n=1 Tax=Saprolegnia parasitica (strain CBS 223.65) TaxID=695850 RepID=A0A067C616_SAPPC|nr:hypothetical protein SPRG_22299 [Saprolegnia parasitica CBS 223.65]KDO22222.1 hypothetical protein SPRG_22299 [Saprolegnia parasitica CBS 223.65]|eukprot:XP_012207090.1 hypothetical protein SPRG_22299 [Saprolegnia parasitica CBS 223.65]